jgi:hypothetical protein
MNTLKKKQQVNNSSQDDRCHHTGKTPGRAPGPAIALLFH